LKITIKRNPSSEHSTQGTLYVDGKVECFTLEDVVRECKIDGCTAIPAGTYKVVINYSNRFKRLLPLLLDVPNYTGVRIHAGNTDKDSRGCVLVGDSPRLDFVGNSRVAFDRLFAKMEKAKDITIEIT
jgi:hypothetical protein